MTRISSALRQQVKKRADNRCEYCHKPDSISVYGHHVDHIIALKHDGETVLENLAYACLTCNDGKGTNIAGYDRQTGELTPLYHPRRQNWDDHFEIDVLTGVITGKTATGRITVKLLNINHPKQIEIRHDLIEAGDW